MTGNADRILDAATLQQLPLQGLKLIEASAGTGKTHTIANLYLRYILNGLEPRQLLVVTFTNAATDELRGRIRQRLHAVLSALKEQDEAASAAVRGDHFVQGVLSALPQTGGDREQAILRLTLAVRSMDEAAIHTIHGFCQRALSDHAFYSGQSMEVSLLADDAPLWEEALQDWWRREISTLDRDRLALVLSAIGGFDRLCARQKSLRASWTGRVLPERREAVPALFDQWRELMRGLGDLALEWQARSRELKDILLESKGTKMLSRAKGKGYRQDELAPVLESLDHWWAAGEFDELHPGFRLLCADVIEENLTATAKKKGVDPALEDAFFSRCQAVLDSVQTLRDSLAVALLYHAHTEAAAAVERRKQQQHVMSYSDQLTRLAVALADDDGERLAAHLRERFPVAMIDEFQDTDALQYGIFRRIYRELPAGAALIMIGDPKQAIYSFRGGDIFTYMRARRAADEQRYTLATNWRSVPGLIEAVNAVFRFRDEAFVYREAIRFEPVQAADRVHRPLCRDGMEEMPLTLWRMPLNRKTAASGAQSTISWSKDEGDAISGAATADEIARLLDGRSQLGDRPLRAGDIAALVRNRRQGARLRELLAERGIAAVTVSHDSVFTSDEAEGLLLLLRAIVHCHDRRRLRQALGSSLLGHDYLTLAGHVDHEDRWLPFVSQIRELQGLWLSRGFMIMFQRLMQGLDVGRSLAQGRDGERRVTNVLHLAELIQQQSAVTPGLEALLAWYEQQLESGEAEESELRLESDSDLVRIATIHASKGLQYPVVFLPYLSTTHAVVDRADGVLHFHDEQGRDCVDLSPSAPAEHLRQADKERLAEDVRLLYVALTRAEAKVYVTWGQVGSREGGRASETALAWLLYSRQSAGDLGETGLQAELGDDEESFAAPLRRLTETAPDVIECCDLPEPAVPGPDRGTEAAPPELAPARFTGRIDTDWRIASFSALTRDVHQVQHGGSPRLGVDPILDFPAGSRIGLFLHALLEELDFTASVTAQVEKLYPALARRYGLDPEHHLATLQHWMEHVVTTPLGMAGLTLDRIGPNQRLIELEFDFSVTGMDMDALNRDLARLAGRPLVPIAVENFRGLVTGIIDLVFEHEGRFYLADYKSNYLGGMLEDYAEAALEQAVLDRRYDVQYLLYSLALHRYLAQRVPDYDYERHFGGAFYFFLRGMRRECGSERGIWHRRPDRELMEQLDRRLRDE